MSQETDRIEADIDQSRHRLSDTLDQLGNKLSPGQMLDEAIGLARGQAGAFANNLGRQVRDNPLPAVLIAAGVALYVMNRAQHYEGPAKPDGPMNADEWRNDSQFRLVEQARWRAAPSDNEAPEAYHARMHDAYVAALGLKQKSGEAIEDFKARVRDTVQRLESSATETRERMAQAFSGAAQAVREGMHDLGEKAGAAKHSAQDLYADNPLAGGAIALAIGAILGSFAPLTELERDTLGEVADKAGRVGADLADRGARAAERVADSIH